ncbi:MAG: aspartyl protease family protein [Chloroflexi bacterium]|nr:aspartyl protease family protein [Chloroflexota bacterium]
MGVFTKRVIFASWDRRAVAEVDAVIDTGSSPCLVPESLAQLLGLELVGTGEFVLADGRVTTFPVAGLRVELEGRVGFVTAAIASDTTQPILGAAALDALGLGVEPGTEKLIPEVIRLLTMTGWRTILLNLSLAFPFVVANPAPRAYGARWSASGQMEKKPWSKIKKKHHCSLSREKKWHWGLLTAAT